MFEFLKFLFIAITVSEGCQSQLKRDTISTLPVPILNRVVISEPATVVVKWDPVTNNTDNPILGFKIKLWEIEKKTIFKYVVDTDGGLVLKEESVPLKKPYAVAPTREPAFVAEVSPDVSEVTFHVKKEEFYEIRAQSFNSEGEGPLSPPHGFKIGEDYTSEDTSTELIQ